MYMKLFFDVLTVDQFHILHHKYFATSGALLQFRSHIKIVLCTI